MAAYYNEFDPFSAQWLRELIKAGCIAPGEVDERSIADVRPDDLVGFTQCHFFAGIGVWSYALRLAGWDDTRPVWTGSCPCQPFSAAGKGAGNADERHLWPVFFELIRACRPPVVLGEQVASSTVIGSAAKRRVVAPSCGSVGAGDERVWLDAVFDDLEAAHYTCGAVSFPACGVGSPHIRQRLYWVAHRDGARHQELQPAVNREVHPRRAGIGPLGGSERGEPDGWLADHGGERLEGWSGVPERASKRAIGQDGVACRQPDPCQINSQWRDVDWLFCRDGKWRPVEPGASPLAHGATARVGRLRGYGNAIVAQQAAAFIGAVMEEVGKHTGGATNGAD